LLLGWANFVLLASKWSEKKYQHKRVLFCPRVRCAVTVVFHRSRSSSLGQEVGHCEEGESFTLLTCTFWGFAAPQDLALWVYWFYQRVPGWRRLVDSKPMGGVSEYLDEAELASGRGRQRVFGIKSSRSATSWYVPHYWLLKSNHFLYGYWLHWSFLKCLSWVAMLPIFPHLINLLSFLCVCAYMNKLKMKKQRKNYILYTETMAFY
jgi:hypothetical protein